MALRPISSMPRRGIRFKFQLDSADDSPLAQLANLAGTCSDAPQHFLSMLTQCGRRQVGVGALAIEPYRRPDQRNAGNRAYHLPMLRLDVRQRLADAVD